MAEKKLKPIHPGEVLREEFLKPFGISAESLAQSIGVQNIREIISERQSVTADTALRLAKFFGTSAQFWLGLQSDYDLDVTRERLGNKLEKEIVPLATFSNQSIIKLCESDLFVLVFCYNQPFYET